MSQVLGLGYVGVNATDLDAWASFAHMLGMQIALHTEDELHLRLDERCWRFHIRKSETDGIYALGWEVPTGTDLAYYAARLEEHGFPVKAGDRADLRERRVTGLIKFADHDGTPLELFHGQQQAATPFASPTGAEFLTGIFGMGHAMQFVSDSEIHRKLYMGALEFRLSDYLDVDGVEEAGTFLHANGRHHSMAFATVPWMGAKLGHIMVEVTNMDLVGRAYDRILAGDAKLGSSLGKHSNDKMTSFYVKTPSGFEIEYGWGGLIVDDATWVPGRWDAPNIWGHQRLENFLEPRI